MTGRRQSYTRSSTRLRLDWGRVAAAVSRPGIDPRAWVELARIDDDPDAMVWDSELGWLVDVTFIGGALDGEGPVVCRVASGFQGTGTGEHRPPIRDGLVVVAIPNGDANDDAIIVGQLHSTGEAAPSAVNGDSIVETGASEGQVAADETHITVAPGADIDQEWRNVRITADRMVLGLSDADQPFARGGDLADALDDLADAVSDFAQALAGSFPAPPNAALTVADVITAAAPLIAAAASFKTARTQYLSTRILGD